MNEEIKSALEREAKKREEQLATVEHSIMIAKKNIAELEQYQTTDPKHHKALNEWHRVVAVGERLKKTLIR